ncbi:MAG: hypothetical protein L6Q54_11495 [Leptospiraceae bacterium]|nr:hypothetical protein [Leptospiraceae bacterium]MCK6381852.1 hypothetical protein [Leptospiraceae bacterium]
MSVKNEKEFQKQKEKLKKEITSINNKSYKSIKALEKKIDAINKKLGVPYEYSSSLEK